MTIDLLTFGQVHETIKRIEDCYRTPQGIDLMAMSNHAIFSTWRQLIERTRIRTGQEILDASGRKFVLMVKPVSGVNYEVVSKVLSNLNVEVNDAVCVKIPTMSGDKEVRFSRRA